MDLQEFPNEFSLRYHVHVLCVHVESVLKFAEDIAEEGPIIYRKKTRRFLMC